jgi:hypothetical protein
MTGLEALEPFYLIGTVDQREQSVEFDIDLVVRLSQGLEKDRVTNEEIAAQAGLFVDDELDQAIGMNGDDVGSVDVVGAGLEALKAVSEDKRQKGKRRNGQRKKTNQESAIKPGIHRAFLTEVKCFV